MTQPKYKYHRRWWVGDVLVRNYRRLIHAFNMDFPVGQPRRHQCILLRGTRPV